MATSNSYNTRQTASTVVAAFSFLILSAYLVLWNQSNRDIKIVLTVALLFMLSVIFAPRKDVTIGAAFLFTGVRWGIATVATHELRAVLAAVVFLGVPGLLVLLEARQEPGL